TDFFTCLLRVRFLSSRVLHRSSAMRRHARYAATTTIVIALAAFGVRLSSQTQEYDFAIVPAFLEQLENGRTIVPAFRIHIDARSNVKALNQDCEVHLAGHLLDQTFGDPTGVVSEPPNDCKFLPNATSPTAVATGPTWRTLIDQHVIGKDCSITGFPRIFT